MTILYINSFQIGCLVAFVRWGIHYWYNIFKGKIKDSTLCLIEDNYL